VKTNLFPQLSDRIQSLDSSVKKPYDSLLNSTQKVHLPFQLKIKTFFKKADIKELCRKIGEDARGINLDE